MSDKKNRSGLSDDEMRQIGMRLQQLRENYVDADGNKPSQEKFAELIGLDCKDSSVQSIMSKIENGKQAVTLAQLMQYSKLCNVSIDSILKGNDFKKKPTPFTITDLCRQIVALDRCGLIDLVDNMDLSDPMRSKHLLGLLIEECEYDEPRYDAEYDYWIKPTAFEEAQEMCSSALRSFIERYASIKRIADDNTAGLEKWMIDSLVEKALADVTSKCGEITTELLQSLLDPLSFMNIPDDTLPFN